MKNFNFKKSTIVIASLLSTAIMIFTFQSCIKDNFDFNKLAQTEWNPNIAVPLVYSSLTVQDILTREDTQGQIIVGADNFCTLVYKGNLFSLLASDLIVIPAQNPTPYTSPSLTPAQIAALSTNGTVTANYSQTINFVSGSTAPNPKVDSITFKTGDIGISLSSDFKFNGNIVVTIPTAKKNGIVFTQTIPLIYTGTVPVLANPSPYSLAGYTFDMTMGGTTFNQFVVNYAVTLTGSGTPPSASDAVTLNQSLSNMQFGRIYGDIGQVALSPDKDTVEISIFKNSLGMGSFTMVDPSVKVVITNSYGVPIVASISQLDGFTPPFLSYPITGSPNPLPINSPTWSQIGQTATGSYTLDNTNSNIVSVINNVPKYVIYQINSLSNPAGPTNNNFVLDTSRFKVDMELDLPLWGTAKDFWLVDTVNFKLDQTVSDDVESAMFRMYNSNGFPIDVDMQIYFVDTLYNVIDSLIIPNQLILKSGIVSPVTGMVTSPTQKVYDAYIDKPRLQLLKNAKYMLVSAVASTANGGISNVKIYSTYRLEVKLGVQFKIKVKG